MDCPLSGGRSGTGPARKVITPRNGNLTNVIPSRLRDCRTNAALSNPEGLSFKVAISLLSHKLRYGRGIPTEEPGFSKRYGSPWESAILSITETGFP